MAEPTSTAPEPVRDLAQERPPDDLKLRLMVLGLACALFLPLIGSFGLWDPWETHYGEVARQMIERQDWISSWWGSHWNRPGESAEGSYFYSKPVFLLWSMSLGMKIFGITAFGARIGVAIVAITGVFMAYMAGSRVWSPRAGLLMAAAVGTSPFYAMLGRQAQTDMPFVGLLTIALCFFLMATFSRSRDADASKASWWTFILITGAFTVFQMHTIGVGLSNWRTDVPAAAAFWLWGPVQVAVYSLILGGVGISLYLSKDRSYGRLHYLWFYVFVALATMAKGLLGFALPGAIIAIYLLASGDWGLLKRAMILRGILVAIAIGFPWYGAMFTRHDIHFWNRFIILDHFKRLASGVHQTDTGSFEHFLRWLGYGLFPWGCLVPAAFATSFRSKDNGEPVDQRRARLFVLFWALFAFTLFTASSTKFHHYIFPAVPALAMLAGLTLEDRLQGRIPERLWQAMIVTSLALCVAIGFDLIGEPQNLKNMFTYRYDRLWAHSAWDPSFTQALRVFVLLGGASISLMLLRSRIAIGLSTGAMVLTGFLISGWALDVYMPRVADTWSQEGLWDQFYSRCTPSDGPPGAHPSKRYCEEPIVAYHLQWRGETFYTHNEIVSLRTDEDWDYFIEVNDDACFYGFGETGSMNGIRRKLPQTLQSDFEILPTGDTLQRLDAIDRELYIDYLTLIGHGNIKFSLFSAGCSEPTDDEPEAVDATE